MPELPEVETTIRYLRPFLQSSGIIDFTVTNKGESAFNVPFGELREAILDRKLLDLARRGKWMLFTFAENGQIPGRENQINIVGHLRMSGRYKVDDQVLGLPHNRFQLHLADGKVINYIDQRRFGTFELVNSFDEYFAPRQLGVDALSDELTSDYLYERLQKLKKNIYTALLDQTVVAGLGNIYVNEALHASGIHPLSIANSLSKDQLGILIQNIQSILTVALKFKGTTLIDNLYQDPEGNTGEFAQMLKVYGKKMDPDIEVLKIGGRSVFVHKSTARSS